MTDLKIETAGYIKDGNVYVTSGITPSLELPWQRESLAVVYCSQRTGETIFTVTDEVTHHHIGTVTSDGTWNRDNFRGFVQECDHSVLYNGYQGGEESPLVSALLDTVDGYVKLTKIGA